MAALERLRRENFDLVITDYKMPQMDGAQFLEQARKINPDLPVIMISGLMNMPELIKVANIGVTLALEKPFRTEELLQSVARFVRPAGPAAPSPLAASMEASELGFQAGPVKVTYPTPTAHLADASEENRRLLESLWQQAARHRHLPFYAPAGTEPRLLAMEIMGWTAPQAGDPVRFGLADTLTDITRSWVVRQDPFPPLLMVDLRDCAWDDRTVQVLTEWIQFIENSGRDLSMSRLLYALPPGMPFDAGRLRLEPAEQAVLAPELPVMLPLRDRLPDVAVYLARLLSREERAALGEPGLAPLLHHPWDGGYQELQACAAALRNLLRECPRPTPAQVRSLLPGAAGAPAEAGLAAYLKRRQKEFIQLHQAEGEDLKRTLLRLGVGGKAADPDAILREELLVYPELLESGNP